MKFVHIVVVVLLASCATTPQKVEQTRAQSLPGGSGARWGNPLTIKLADIDTEVGPEGVGDNPQVFDALAVKIRLVAPDVVITALPLTQWVSSMLFDLGEGKTFGINGTCALIIGESPDKEAVTNVASWLVRMRRPESSGVFQAKPPDFYKNGSVVQTDNGWRGIAIQCIPEKFRWGVGGIDVAVVAPLRNAWPALFIWRDGLP